MKRRGFLASLAAGLGVAVMPQPKDMEKYYKVETIARDGKTDEEIKEEINETIRKTAHLQCSGVTMCSG